MKGDGHYPQLDGLRGLTAIAVVAWHTLPRQWFGALDLGAVSVWLFFVLSGYLITRSLLRDKFRRKIGSAWKAFYVRRALRIFPVYYATLGAVLAAGVPIAWAQWPWYAAYLGNVLKLLRPWWDGPLDHFWSLAVEEQFYLFWPAVVLLLTNRRAKQVALGMVAIAPLARVACSVLGVPGWYYQTPCCLDAFGAGALLAFTEAAEISLGSIRRYFICWGLLAFIASTILGAAGAEAEMQAGPLRALWTAIACWLVTGAREGLRGPLGTALGWKPLRVVGMLSYALYAFHVPIAASLIKLQIVSKEGVVTFLTVFLSTLALAAISWVLVERPLLRLRTGLGFARPTREFSRLSWEWARGIVGPFLTRGSL